jgi:hypothetical protein
MNYTSYHTGIAHRDELLRQAAEWRRLPRTARGRDDRRHRARRRHAIRATFRPAV